MSKILRSLFYDYFKKSLMSKVFFLIMLVNFSMLFIFGKMYGGDQAVPTMSEFAASNIQALSIFAGMFVVVNTGWICTADFNDKTANYELMTGHTRFEIYSARVTMSIITGVSAYYLMLLLPVAAGCFIWKWGSCVSVGDMALRWFMLLFPVVRIICETAFAAFVVRKLAAVLISGFFVYEALNIIPVSAGLKYTSCILGSSNLMKLTTVDKWTTYGLGANQSLGNDKVWLTYDTMLSGGYILTTILVSVTAAALFFYLGYTFFRYDDIQ